ncbi:unnamed protein product, partial [marine sediment metagenome]
DMGCGYGPIGIVLAKENPDSTIYMIDINSRAFLGGICMYLINVFVPRSIFRWLKIPEDVLNIYKCPRKLSEIE